MSPRTVRTLPLTGSGYAPNSPLTVTYSTPASPAPAFLTAVTTDANGGFKTTAVPPAFSNLATLEQTFDVTAADEADPPLAASTRFKQVLFGYTTTPRVSSSAQVVRHTVRGFPAHRRTYLHFRLRGVTKRTVLLGTTSSPCGIASRRMAQLPGKVEVGSWTVYADQRKAFSIRTRPQVRSSFVVRRSAP
jgi:hypothetical protein